MSLYEIVFIAFMLAMLIYLTFVTNKIYNRKEEKEKRSELKKVKYNPDIHETCNLCCGTGQDISWGSCMECDGRGFVLKE